MLRDEVKSALTIAMKGKDKQGVSTLRLILAAIKDRDIAARSKGVTDGIGEDEILSLMQSMIKQRRESIEMYTKGGRAELAQQETDEISVIETIFCDIISSLSANTTVFPAISIPTLESQSLDSESKVN